MHALKERVSDKLSRLFSDSPSQAPDQQTQARPSTKQGRSLYSLLSFVLPSRNFDRSESNENQNETEQFYSPSFSWRSKSFSLQDRPLDPDYENQEMTNHYEENGTSECIRSSSCENKEKLFMDVQNGGPGSGRSNHTGSENFEDASSVEESMADLMDDSLFISPDLYEFLRSSLPNIVKSCQWVLLYSTARHGISLRTLIRRIADLSGPCLLITGDKEGAVFGGLLEAPLRPTAKRKYQGSNQTFVFTTIYGEPRLFRPTGANRYFYICLNDLLAFGGGGNFALCLDGDLLSGSSGPCETFGNLCLAHCEEFEPANVELWGFTHGSRYLT